MGTYEYVFTALKGIQAGREYYITMCPMKLIPKIFLFQEDELPPKLRAQRTLNKARIPEIASYLTSNSNNYTFSSITASIDGKAKFEKLQNNGQKMNDVGHLHISMDSRFLINDGQHRRAAIEQALKQNPDLGEETISVVFFIDIGLKKSQQMFADLNKHAIRPTKSLGILYDHRDPLSNLTRELADNISVFKYLTEKEKTTISNRSTKLFTLSSIYQGTLSLLRKTPKSKKLTQEEKKIAFDFWDAVCSVMKDWQLASEKNISTAELRRDYIHAHALIMHVIGKAGSDLISEYGDKYKEKLNKLSDIDWRRSNAALWEGRAMTAGKISKSHNSVILTTNVVKKKLGLKLREDEKSVEKAFLLES